MAASADVGRACNLEALTPRTLPIFDAKKQVRVTSIIGASTRERQETTLFTARSNSRPPGYRAIPSAEYIHTAVQHMVLGGLKLHQYDKHLSHEGLFCCQCHRIIDDSRRPICSPAANFEYRKHLNIRNPRVSTYCEHSWITSTSSGSI